MECFHDEDCYLEHVRGFLDFRTSGQDAEDAVPLGGSWPHDRPVTASWRTICEHVGNWAEVTQAVHEALSV
jgi:hypothetical protein